MKLITITILIIIFIFIILSVGYYLSVYIENNLEYVFFWIMYILSTLTIINLVAGGYYYSVMKYKTGPRGIRGDKGNKGDKGETGKCSIKCRNNICTNDLYQHIIDVLIKLDKENGGLGDLKVETDLKNPYIKEKIKSICLSNEYNLSVPYKGPEKLNEYIKSIWTDLTTRIYNSGGLNYFRTIGAEYDWDWLDDNPWDEFKKYDIYYWGLGKEYHPIIEDKDIEDKEGKDIFESETYPVKDNEKYGDYDDDDIFIKTRKKKDIKYSVLSYINIPQVEEDGKTIIVNHKFSGKEIKLYNAHTYENSDEILSQYNKTKNIKYLNPLSFLVISDITSSLNNHKCLIYNKNKLSSSICNSYEPEFIFNIEINNKSKVLNEFKLQHTSSGKYLKLINSKFKISDNGDIFTFRK